MAGGTYSKASPIPLWNLVAGLMTDAPTTQIPPEATPDALNVVGVNGKLQRRPGFSSVLADLGGSLAVHHIGRLTRLDGTSDHMVLARDTGTNAVTVHRWDGAAWVNVTGAAVLTGDDDIPPTSTTFKGVWYFTTGNNNLYEWDPAGGGNIAEVTNGTATIRPFPVPRIVACWDGRLWTADSQDGAGNSVPYRLAWADYLEDNIWRAVIPDSGSAGYQDLVDESEGDRQAITAMVPLGERMVVLKTDHVYVTKNVGEPKYYETLPLTRGVGAVNQAVIARYFETLFFLGDDNVYMMEGTQVSPIGDAILDYLKTKVDNTKLHRSFAIMDVDSRQYWLFMPNADTTSGQNVVFVYDIATKAWWEQEINNTTLKPLCGRAHREDPLDYRLIVGSQNGSFYQQDWTVSTDAGSEMGTPYWKSRIFDSVQATAERAGGDKFETSEWHRFMVHAESGRMRVKVRVGPNLDAMEEHDCGKLILNGDDPRYVSPAICDRFHQVKLEFYHSSAPEIEGFTFSHLPRGEVRH
jgi:hypothetical protein